MKILALDLGTSSVRGMVLDQDAIPIPGAFTRRRVTVSTGRDGTGTLDGPTYLAQLIECIDELAATGHLDGVGLVGTSAQWHSIIPIGTDGAPLGPMLTWLDTRPAPLPGTHGPIDEEDFHQRTGTWWHRLYWTVRVPWLRLHSGSRSARFTDLAGYVHGALLDDAPMSVSQASGTGMLDLRAAAWDEEAVALAGVTLAELPAIAPPGWCGRLRAEYARRWPALRTVEWRPATGDGAAANIGSQGDDANRVVVTVGTSTAVRLVQSLPVGAALPPLPHRLWRYRVDRDRIVTGAAYSAGGNLYHWAKRQLRLPDSDGLAAALATVAPGATVPADPRFGGDRPPGHAPAGSGRLGGLSFGTTAVEIFAGLMDGVCRQVAEDLTVIESVAGGRVEVVLGGGALAKSAWWRQAFAAALAPRTLYHALNPEVGVIGAAVIAAGLPYSRIKFERIDPVVDAGGLAKSTPRAATGE